MRDKENKLKKIKSLSLIYLWSLDINNLNTSNDVSSIL